MSLINQMVQNKKLPKGLKEFYENVASRPKVTKANSFSIKSLMKILPKDNAKLEGELALRESKSKSSLSKQCI